MEEKHEENFCSLYESSVTWIKPSKGAQLTQGLRGQGWASDGLRNSQRFVKKLSTDFQELFGSHFDSTHLWTTSRKEATSLTK